MLSNSRFLRLFQTVEKVCFSKKSACSQSLTPNPFPVGRGYITGATAPSPCRGLCPCDPIFDKQEVYRQTETAVFYGCLKFFLLIRFLVYLKLFICIFAVRGFIDSLGSLTNSEGSFSVTRHAPPIPCEKISIFTLTSISLSAIISPTLSIFSL